MNLTIIDHLKKVLRHEQWATRAILETLRSSGHPPQRAVRLMSHIIGAEMVWLARIEGKASTQPVWPEWSLDELIDHSRLLEEPWTRYLASLTAEDLGREVTYTNSRGEKFGSSIHDIISHLGLHAAYHRGQVNAALREADLQPPAIDYIHAARNGFI